MYNFYNVIIMFYIYILNLLNNYKKYKLFCTLKLNIEIIYLAFNFRFCYDITRNNHR